MLPVKTFDDVIRQEKDFMAFIDSVDVHRIKSMYDLKIPTTKIAEIYDVSTTTLFNYMEKHKIKRVRGSCNFKIIDKENIIDLYINQKKSLTEVSKILGVSRNKKCEI